MSIGSFIKWIFNGFRKPTSLKSLVVYDDKQERSLIKATENDKFNKFYLADKANPNLLVIKPIPTSTVLPLQILGEKGGGYPLGTVQQQAMAVKQMINGTLFYLQKSSPKKFNSWSVVKNLAVFPRAGKDLNAYYDRTSLKFFYFGDPTKKENVYTCDSHTVVAHELGHAVLDILRPDWWNVANLEHWSLHEAFGDISALLGMLQYDQIIDVAIAQTDGNLIKSNILSRLAPDLGQAIYNITQGKNGEPANCMRDLSTRFIYQNPNTLPRDGRDDAIVAECHSFGRIFSNAFYSILIQSATNIAEQYNLSMKEALKQGRDLLTDIFLKAIVSCPNSNKIFEALAKQMLAIDAAQGKKLQSVMTTVFQDRKIISAQLKMLSDQDMTFDSLINNVKTPVEIQMVGDNKIVVIQQNNTIKVSDKMQMSAQNFNPLYELEVIVANQAAYAFDNNDKLIEVLSATEDELIESTIAALDFLNEQDLVGNHNSALFEIVDNKLQRKQFVCKCNKPNYCDPNAPEYGKPWKPANNSGCVACYNPNCKPEPCDCVETKIPAPPKLGCYTSVKAGNRNTYKVGSKASRRVC